MFGAFNQRVASVIAVSFAAVLVASVPASAHESPRGEGMPAKVAEVLGDDAVPISDDLYRIKPEGPNLITHGPDPKASLGTKAKSAGIPAGGIGFRRGDAERSPVCASEHYQHVLYGRLATSEDRFATVKPEIQAAMRRMNAVLNADAVASSGISADYKVACDGAGQVQVDSFISTGTGFEAIVTSARAAGFNLSTINYTIFFDASTAYCGVGSYAEDESPLITNANNTGGGYAVAYRDCWYDETPMHENGHNMGAVQYNAPHSTGTGGHCVDEDDVMCYSPDGGNLNQNGTIFSCADRVYFDCGYDTYFNPAPAPGSYLSTHWNIGSAVNRFIALGLGGGGDEGSSEPPDSSVVTLLRNGVRTEGQAAQPGAWRYFKIRVPKGRRALRVVTRSDAQDDLDLYVRRGAKPGLGNYSCRSGNRGASEGCTIRRPRPGTWYIGVYSFDASEGAAFTIRATRLSFRR